MSAHLWQHKRDPWMPPDYDKHVVYAVRAFAAGRANETQQHLVWEYLSYLGAVGDKWQDLVYRPGPSGERDTTFVSGKQFPILALRKLLRPEFTPKEADGSIDSQTQNPAKPAAITAPKKKRRKR